MPVLVRRGFRLQRTLLRLLVPAHQYRALDTSIFDTSAFEIQACVTSLLKTAGNPVGFDRASCDRCALAGVD